MNVRMLLAGLCLLVIPVRQSAADMLSVGLVTGNEPLSFSVLAVRDRLVWTVSENVEGGLSLGFGRTMLSSYNPWGSATRNGQMAGDRCTIIPMATFTVTDEDAPLELALMLRSQWSLPNKQAWGKPMYFPTLFEVEGGPVFTASERTYFRTAYRITLSSPRRWSRGWGTEYLQEIRPSDNYASIDFRDPNKPNYGRRGRQHAVQVTGQQNYFVFWGLEPGIIRLTVDASYLQRWMNTGRADGFRWRLEYVVRRYQ